MKRRLVLGAIALGGYAMASPEDVLKQYQKQLPPNYGPGAVFRVQATSEGSQIILTGRVLDHAEQLTQRFAPQRVDNRVVSFPYVSVGPRCYGLVTAKRVDMRAKPDPTSELVSQAVHGDGVLILTVDAGFYEILRQWDGYVGWVAQSAVQTLTRDEFSITQAQPRQMQLVDTSDHYAGAILTSASTRTRPVTLSQSPEQLRERVLQAAQSLYEQSKTTPYPYLWGGTYGNGLDCSGFTQTVYRLAGYAIPRDTYQQQAFGRTLTATPTKMQGLLPGDLLFFSENRRRATHVGLYLGAGDFLHCSGSKGNRGLGRNNLAGNLPYEGFLRRIWWGAARMIPTTSVQSQGLYAQSVVY